MSLCIYNPRCYKNVNSSCDQKAGMRKQAFHAEVQKFNRFHYFIYVTCLSCYPNVEIPGMAIITESSFMA